MVDQISFTPLRALDQNGYPVAAALAYFYQSGTSTLQTVYADAAGLVPHPSPLVADARGVFAQVYSNVTLKVTVTSSDAVVLPGFPMDPAPKTAIGGTGAAAITFAPTAAIPSTNVQDAIERVQTNISTGTTALGLGVTGDAAVIANLDAAGTAAGRYRIDATTIGTFPAGSIASDGGIVDIARETAAAAAQTVWHGASQRKSTRDLVAGVWGAWREDITANETLVAGDVIYHNGTNMARLAKGSASSAFVMNADGTAPEWVSTYGCRAWVNFNGDGAANIRSSQNVASVTRNALGNYTVNFLTAAPATSYAVMATVGSGAGTGYSCFAYVGGKGAGSCQIRVVADNASAQDSAEVSAVFYW